MKTTTLLIIFIIIHLFGNTQQTLQQIPHCDCVDKIDIITPNYDGKYERRCKGKIIETGTFKNGLKSGEWVTFTPKGNVIRRINYLNGKLHGTSQFFYVSGKLKLSASFIENDKNGLWKYYSEKGKTYIDGEYLMNKPIDIWTIKDLKGNNIQVQYDFSNSTYLKNNRLEYHKNTDVIQNDNTEWFGILLNPERKEYEGSAPLGGFIFANDLLIELIQVPIDFWDTYVKLEYKIQFRIASDNSYSLTTTEIDESMDDEVPVFAYILKTNDTKKLHKVEHSEISKEFLEMKIDEALNFMPPWIFSSQTIVEVDLPYVMNQIEGIDKFFK